VDLDGHAHVARARGALDATGCTDRRGHGCGLRETGAELFEALPARGAAVAPEAVRARVVPRRDGGVILTDHGRSGLAAVVIGRVRGWLRLAGRWIGDGGSCGDLDFPRGTSCRRGLVLAGAGGREQEEDRRKAVHGCGTCGAAWMAPCLRAHESSMRVPIVARSRPWTGHRADACCGPAPTPHDPVPALPL